MFVISNPCVVKNVIPALSTNSAEYIIVVPTAINIKVTILSVVHKEGFLLITQIAIAIDIIHLPNFENSIFIPNICKIRFLGLTKALSNSPFEIILSNWSNALKKHSAIENPKKEIAKQIKTSSNVYPLTLPNLLNKNIIAKRENIDVAVCPKQDIINVFLYSSIDFNCIEKYCKYNFNLHPLLTTLYYYF